MKKKRPPPTGAIAVLAKSIKLFKFAKIGLTMVTMALSVAAYSRILGWAMAFGGVGLLFIHEMGHVIALRRKGIKATAPMFLPFLGAVIFSPPIQNQDDEAYVGYGGPLAGMLGILAMIGLWTHWPGHPKVLIATAFLAAALNLLQMIPARPLDGGRVTQAVGAWFVWIGAAMLIALVILTKQGGYMLLCVLCAIELPIPLITRPILGAGLTIIMTVMFCHGMGSPIKYINVLDVIVAVLCVSLPAYRVFDLRRDLNDTTRKYHRCLQAIEEHRQNTGDEEFCTAMLAHTEAVYRGHKQYIESWEPDIPTPSSQPWIWFLRWFVLTAGLAVLTKILLNFLLTGR